MRKNRDNRPLPAKSDLAKGARLALTNARRHLRVADLLGNNRLFGPASTHVILALEELAKSLVLTFITMGVDVPKSLLGDVMKRHSTRHDLTLGILFSQVIRSLVFTAIARASRSESVGSIEQIQKALEKEVRFAGSASSRTNSYNAILEWILDANDSKNLGLYVDFDGEKWTHPGSVNKKRFIFGYRIAEDLIREKGRIIEKFHRAGLQADEAFKALMREVATRPASKDREQFLKDMVALVLK